MTDSHDSHELETSTPRLSRRRFAALAVGGVGAVAAGVVSAFALFEPDAPEGEAVRFFDVAHGPNVYVTMTNGTEFVVEVKEVGSRRGG